MDIKAMIMSTLTPVCSDISFLSRDDDGVFPFLVFNVTETPIDFGDDEEEACLHLVSVDIFSKPDYNFEIMKLEIIAAMKAAGFKKQIIPAAEYLEKEALYNQPLGFSYYEEY